MQTCPDFGAAKIDELALLSVGKATTDLNGFASVFGINLHLLSVLYGFEGSHGLLSCAKFRHDLGHGSL